MLQILGINSHIHGYRIFRAQILANATQELPLDSVRELLMRSPDYQAMIQQGIVIDDEVFRASCDSFNYTLRNQQSLANFKENSLAFSRLCTGRKEID